MTARLVLVGLPGTGKSTVGHAVARRLAIDFVDTDTVVGDGQPAADRLREWGEPEFRRREAAALETALAVAGVVATGGGIVTTERGRALLAQAPTVWLRAPTSTLVRRTKRGDRPLLRGDRRARLDELATQRTPWYEEVARAVVDVNRPLRAVVDEICGLLEEWAA